MINNRQNGRRRGRGGPQVRNGTGNSQDRGSRIDNRARGNAAQLHEKYRNLARDTQTQGDRVMTEYYLQFADHYFRVLSENRSRTDDPQQRRLPGDYRDDPRDGNEFDDNGDSFEGEEGFEGERYDRRPQQPQQQAQPQQHAQPQRPPREQQPERSERQDYRSDRQPQDRQVQDRQSQDRQVQDRQASDRQPPDRDGGDRQRQDRPPVDRQYADRPPPQRQPEPRVPEPVAAAPELPLGDASEEGEGRRRRRRGRRPEGTDAVVEEQAPRIEADRLPPAFAAEPVAIVSVPDAPTGDDAAEAPKRRRARRVAPKDGDDSVAA